MGEIDRDERRLTAKGNVRSQFVEQSRAGQEEPSSVLTLIRAPEMAYTRGKTGTAQYRGAVMNRAGLEVRAAEMRGRVCGQAGRHGAGRRLCGWTGRISQPAPGRVRRGAAEHAEYS